MYFDVSISETYQLILYNGYGISAVRITSAIHYNLYYKCLSRITSTQCTMS